MGKLINTSGVTVFEGTIDGALPAGWTSDGADPANVSAHNGSLGGALAVFATQIGGILIVVGDNSRQISSGSPDPSAGGGIPAAVGSLWLRENGQLWIKTGAGNTDWSQVATVP